MLGPYRITGVLGAGGMGVVYRAADIRLSREVALKLLPPESAHDVRALDRLKREAHAVSALNHPHICTLFDIGDYEGQPFLVMELLEGQSLKERVAAGPLALGEVLELGFQITDALEAAHAKSIVHRDIKPANVFVTGPASGHPGQAKILDFGLAKLLSEPARAQEGWVEPGAPAGSAAATISLTGRRMGTAAYMSPEQARGEPVDERTDLFSLGVTLYEMATGRLPFEGDTPALLLEAILTQQPTRPRELNPALPAELERIIRKALEKDRAARYQTAAESHADLERLRPAKTRAARWLLAVAAVLLLALGITFAGTKLGWFGAPSGALELTPRQVTANPAEDFVPRGAISPDGQYVAYLGLAGIHVRGIDTGETRTIPAPEGYCFR